MTCVNGEISSRIIAAVRRAIKTHDKTGDGVPVPSYTPRGPRTPS